MYVRMYVHLLTYNMYVCQPYYTHAHTYVHCKIYMSVHCYDSVHTLQYMYVQVCMYVVPMWCIKYLLTKESIKYLLKSWGPAFNF